MPEIKPKEWGREEWIVKNDHYTGKILHLKEGGQCSYHLHKKKTETLYILEGLVFMEYNGYFTPLGPGHSVTIKPETYHSFIGAVGSKILEFSTMHDSSDCYRDKKRLSCTLKREELNNIKKMAKRHWEDLI